MKSFLDTLQNVVFFSGGFQCGFISKYLFNVRDILIVACYGYASAIMWILWLQHELYPRLVARFGTLICFKRSLKKFWASSFISNRQFQIGLDERSSQGCQFNAGDAGDVYWGRKCLVDFNARKTCLSFEHQDNWC